MFTTEELKNIAILINKAPITGAESVTVALLLEKISKLITPVPEVKPEVKKQKDA